MTNFDRVGHFFVDTISEVDFELLVGMKVLLAHLKKGIYRGGEQPACGVKAIILWIVWTMGWGGQVVQAQAGSSPRDSLLSYDLAEIVVGGGDEQIQEASALQRIGLAQLAQIDAASVEQVARLIPAAHVQTNSRGETLVYLRNAGERQVALFFDGALINVPWDNRVDLSFIPSAAIGGMTVAKGASSVLYGTNVLGGAINLTTRTLGSPGRLTEVSGSYGDPRQVQANIAHFARTERFSFTGALSVFDDDGQALSGDAQLPFSQISTALRTNTDRQLLSGFAQASWQIQPNARVGLALLHVDGNKGVAPEGHLDPLESRVRFWRYPMWQNSLFILSGEQVFSDRTRLRGAVWGSRFAQDIESYTSSAYQQRTDLQEDEDHTFGTRLTLFHQTADGEFRFALNALTSTHRQRDSELGNAPPHLEPRLSYQQHVVSLGSEYHHNLSPATQVVVGGSLDILATPKTGDKPGRDPLTDIGLTSGVIYQINDAWQVKVSAGRKVRFPTMRELFGEALNRFLVNPDLKPETSFLTEASLGVQQANVSGEVIVFLSRTFDTIDQRRVDVDGVTKRQRINLEGSRVYGIETAGAFQLTSSLRAEGHITWMVPRAFADDKTVRLTEKPEWLSSISAVVTPTAAVSVLAESVYIGRAYGLQEDNTLTALPTAWQFNTRISYRHYMAQLGVFAELFLRVDNLTDVLVLPQLGLPGPGREVRGGLNVSF